MKTLNYYYKRELKKNKYYKIIKTIISNGDLIINGKHEDYKAPDLEWWTIDYNKYYKLCVEIDEIECKCLEKAKKRYNDYLDSLEFLL